MTLLVTGATGLVGSAVVAAAHAAGRPVVPLARSALDLTQVDAVERALDTHRPSAVLNAAAQADVNRAEEDEAWSQAVNGTAPRQLAGLCRQRGIRLVHLSTDYVLTGPDTGLLTEDLPPDPRSAYARSKLIGEQGVLDENGLVVRIQWVYAPGRRGFFTTALQRLAAGLPVGLVVDQVGIPTAADWLGGALLPSLSSGPTGLFHLAPQGEATAAAWIRAAADHLGLSTASARSAFRGDFPGAYRPARSCLDGTRYAAAFGVALPPWEQLLHASLDAAGRRWLS